MMVLLRPLHRLSVVLPIVALLAASFLVSCTMNQRMVLRSDGSGSVDFRVTVSKLLMDAASGLSQGAAQPAQGGEFDIPKIRQVFSQNPTVKLGSLSSPSSGVLTGSFTFSDIDKLFSSSAHPVSGEIVSLAQTSDGNVLRVHITRGNFADIARLAGLSNNPLYQMFGPEQNAATSVGDLNQMMVYVLGDSGPAALKTSSIDIEVSIDGKVLNQTGGVLEGNTVHFHIPLVQLLLLSKPLDYSITFS